MAVVHARSIPETRMPAAHAAASASHDVTSSPVHPSSCRCPECTAPRLGLDRAVGFPYHVELTIGLHFTMNTASRCVFFSSILATKPDGALRSGRPWPRSPCRCRWTWLSRPPASTCGCRCRCLHRVVGQRLSHRQFLGLGIGSPSFLKAR